MRNFLILFIGVIFNYITFASDYKIVTIDAKEYEGYNNFYFSNEEKLKIKISYNNGKITLVSDFPLEIKNLSTSIFNKLTKNISLSKDKKTITIETKGRYINANILESHGLASIVLKLDDDNAGGRDFKILIPEKLSKKLPPKLINVNISRNSGNSDLTFPVDDDVATASFIRGSSLWVVLDKKFNFKFPKNELFYEYNILPHSDFTIIKFSLSKPLNGIFFKSKNSWILRLGTKNIKTEEIKVEKGDNNSEMLIHSKLNSNVIEFSDPDIGDDLVVIPSKNPKSGIDKIIYSNNFTLIPTFQGVVIAWISDKHDLKISENNITINTNSLIESEAIVLSKNFEQTNPIKTSVPFEYDNEMNLNFISIQSSFRSKLANSDDMSIDPILMDFTEFYFVEGLYREALSTILLINENNRNFVENNYRYYILKSILYLKTGMINDAIYVLRDLQKKSIPTHVKKEIDLWYIYAEYMKNPNTDLSLNSISLMDDYINFYPNDLYWDIIFTDLAIAKKKPDIYLTRDIFKVIKDPTSIDIRDKLHLYKASYFAEIRDFLQAKGYFEGVKNNSQNRKNYAEAEFGLIKMEYLNKNIDIDEAINRLEDLKFVWRGDQLEFDILIEKAYLSFDKEDYINSLRSFKYALNAFPDNPKNFDITRRMVSIYNRYLFGKNGLINKLDDFQAVALFYEFRELTPIGSEGDEFILNIARRLINLDLLDEAEVLLNHQVKYRLRGERRVVTSEHLAAIYLLNKKPANALRILVDTDQGNYSYREHLSRKRLKAKAYYDLERYNDALLYVEDMDQQALDIRRDLYFKMSDWENYIRITESDIIPILDVGKILPENLNSEALRLAICYSMLDRFEDLKLFVNILKSNNKQLIDAIKFISLKSEPINIKNLDSQFDLNKIDGYFKKIINEMFSI